MNNWFYNNNGVKKEYTLIEQFPEGNNYGFIYKIYLPSTSQYYIGKKILHNTTNVKLGKKEKKKLAEEKIGSGRPQSKKKVIKESNWLTYFGSNKELIRLIQEKGEDSFIREIIHFCKDKKNLTYYEIKYQMEYNVLIDPFSLNDNISGHYFRKDFQ